jgi:transposase-like protein
MKRKRYSTEFKAQVVKDAVEVGNASVVARRHGISVSMVSRWVREQNGSKNPLSMTNIRAQRTNSDPKSLSTENDKLKKIIGEKELEIEILRDLLKKTNPAFKTR